VRNRLMYIEGKSAQANGTARVRRVTLIKMGRMVYDSDRAYVPKRDRNLGSNFADAQSGEPFWIAVCRKDGADSMAPRTVHIDEEARSEYWHNIRRLPESEANTTYQSPGKL
jgi:hypothetical protein